MNKVTKLSLALAALFALLAPGAQAQEVIHMDPIVIYGRAPGSNVVEVSREVIHQDALVTLVRITYRNEDTGETWTRVEGYPTPPEEGGADFGDLGDTGTFGQPDADDQAVRPGDADPEPMSNDATFEPDFGWND